MRSIDLPFTARLFARQPVILLLTLAGLSLGLGISTAGFSIMNATVLRGEGLADAPSARLSVTSCRDRLAPRATRTPI